MRTLCFGLLLGVFTCSLFPGKDAQAQTEHRVPDDFTTIAEALVDAVDGDTVLVSRGTYVKDFTPKAGVTIRGEETAETFLTDAGAIGTIADTGAGGTLERFTIEGDWKFRNAQDLVIRNCAITGSTGIAIEVEDSPGTVISNNVFYGNATALKISNVIGSTSSGSVLANAFVDNTGTALNVLPVEVAIGYNLFANNTIDTNPTDPGGTGDNAVPAADSFAVDGFVDAAGGDFHLVEGGGDDCIDLVPADILADPDGSDADCGAYGGPSHDPNPRRVTGFLAVEGTVPNSADLTWTGDDNYLVTGYRLHYGTVSGNYSGTDATEGDSPIDDLADRDTTRASLNNLTVSASPPLAPANLVASPGDGRLFLSWSPATGATGYTVLYGTQSGNLTLEVDVGNSTTHVLGRLTNGVTYFLAVRPYASTEYFFAVSALGTTPEEVPPPDPAPETPAGQLSDEFSVLFDKTEGDTSVQISGTPGQISGYPALEDSGFCFARALRLDTANPVGPPARLAIALLLLAGGITAARRGKRGLLLSFLVLAMAATAGSARATDPRWSLDARAGAFWPSERSWDKHYDNDPLPEVKLGLGYRLTSLLEFGVEAGYRRAEGTVRRTDGGSPLGQALAQTLVVVPLQGYALVRLRASESQLLVPYLAAGFSRYLYRHEVEGGRDAEGRQDGYHARAGLRLSLHRFDPRRADRSRQQYGLLGSALTLEAQFAQVDDFGDADTDLGGWSLFGGLNLEF